MTASYLANSLAKARAQGDLAVSVWRSKSLNLEQTLLGGSYGGISNLPILTGKEQNKAKAYGYYKHWVFVFLSAIARRLAAQTYGAGKKQGAAAQKQYATTKMHAARKRLLPTHIKEMTAGGQDIEQYAEHPALDMLARPNPLQSKSEFLTNFILNMYIAGEAYWIGGDFGNDGGKQLWVPPTPWVRPEHKGKMFSGYRLNPTGIGEGVPIPAEAVRRFYFPDPMDPKGCVSPLLSQADAVETDGYIQQSQKQTFKRIDPKIGIKIGEGRDAEGKPNGMPVLTGPQRSQLRRSIQEMFRQDNTDGFAIFDGLVAGIERLQMNPSEMDWMQSGEQVKKRLSQAFGVNPMIVGEVIAGSYAQAYVVERVFLDNVINPLADMVTTALDDFVVPMFDDGGGLLLWLELAEANNPELRTRQFDLARKNNDVTGDEYRTHILGLPPKQGDSPERAPLTNTVGGMTGYVSMMTAIGQGYLPADAAINAFQMFFNIDEKTAKQIVGEAEALPPPAPAVGFGGPPKPQGEEKPPGDEDDEGDTGPIPSGSNEPDGSEPKGKSLADLLKASGTTKITRGQVKAAHRRQVARLEKEVKALIEPTFRDQYRSAAKELAKKSDKVIDKENAEKQSAKLASSVFDPREWDKELKSAIAPGLLKAMAEGAATEDALKLYAVARKRARGEQITIKQPGEDGTKATSASRMREQLEDEYDLDASDIETEWPEWFLEAASERLAETFAQDYWQGISDTTASQVEHIIKGGIEDGLSIREIAEILQEEGDVRSKSRAINIARTEVGNSLNAGHESGIRQISEETGMKVGKTWLSVLGPTTREDHAEADGQTVDIDDTFEVGGEQARWPSDERLSPAQRCACQCTVLSDFAGGELDSDESEPDE